MLHIFQQMKRIHISNFSNLSPLIIVGVVRTRFFSVCSEEIDPIFGTSIGQNVLTHRHLWGKGLEVTNFELFIWSLSVKIWLRCCEEWWQHLDHLFGFQEVGQVFKFFIEVTSWEDAPKRPESFSLKWKLPVGRMCHKGRIQSWRSSLGRRRSTSMRGRLFHDPGNQSLFYHLIS